MKYFSIDSDVYWIKDVLFEMNKLDFLCSNFSVVAIVLKLIVYRFIIIKSLISITVLSIVLLQVAFQLNGGYKYG